MNELKHARLEAVQHAAGDLDKLLGSRLKSVRPAGRVRQTDRQAEEAAGSPVAALRGQLRRIKLEEGEGAGVSSPPRAAGSRLGLPAEVPHSKVLRWIPLQTLCRQVLT